MSKSYFDRYSYFKTNSSIAFIPFIRIPILSTDLYDVFDSNLSRLDEWAYKYYGDANADFLIRSANPEYSSLSYSIPNQTVLRIPYPYSSAQQRYVEAVKNYIQYNSLE